MGKAKRNAVRESSLGHYGRGVDAPWYQGWDLTDAERQTFRDRSRQSRAAKMASLRRDAAQVQPIPVPGLQPATLMPRCHGNSLRSLSLFSGGGGLDLGFDLAGFEHVASFEVVRDAADTLRRNRPNWDVRSGASGNVATIDWHTFRGQVDVVHGGPPCQPFSVAGRQKGGADERELLPEFARAVAQITPLAFVVENVAALAGPKFADYLNQALIAKVRRNYHVSMGLLAASSFGVPQSRTRLFIVGIRMDRQRECRLPDPTHTFDHLVTDQSQRLLTLDPSTLKRCMGAREALGLPDIGYDALAPTLRSGLTGPRHTTSILSSVAALKTWSRLGIWPNGVAADRERASRFAAAGGHFRLAVADCALLQGFPESWGFDGAVYMAIGQIGNSVAPPVAYSVARAVSRVLLS